MIKGLHRNPYRCRNSEATRKFYEDSFGLPLASALAIETTKTGRGANVLHTLYEMGDGSYLAFFGVPGRPFEFTQQHDFDLHIALGRCAGDRVRFGGARNWVSPAGGTRITDAR